MRHGPDKKTTDALTLPAATRIMTPDVRRIHPVLFTLKRADLGALCVSAWLPFSIAYTAPTIAPDGFPPWSAL